MGGHPLAPIRLASTLHLLHVSPRHSILGGMAFTTANACSMSVLPQLHARGTSPLIWGVLLYCPPQQLWLLPSWPRQPSCASWGASVCPTFPVGEWGASSSSLECTLVCVWRCTLSPGPWGYPHATTLVASSLVFVGLLHHPSLPQDDHQSSSGSDITMSFPGPGQGLPPPLLYHTRPPPAPSGPASPPSSTAKVLKFDLI
jgi:hypothetical protein